MLRHSSVRSLPSFHLIPTPGLTASRMITPGWRATLSVKTRASSTIGFSRWLTSSMFFGRAVEPVVQLPVVQQRPERSFALIDAGHDRPHQRGDLADVFHGLGDLVGGGRLARSAGSLNLRSVRSVISIVPTMRSMGVLPSAAEAG